MSVGNRFLRRYRPGNWQEDLDLRSEGQRDVDRIEYYSPFFHRLANKTQIISPSSTRHVTHSRQTHARKVGQFASAIAQNLLYKPNGTDVAARAGGLDIHIARAAGAAHDLGHPPFGHIGERELHTWAVSKELDGFEANAQSYRILTKLGAQPGVAQGMDVTFATQNAVLKYPRYSTGDEGGGWGVYASEAEDFGRARACLPEDRRAEASLEALVMDFADDMTFALHDFEDFYLLGALEPSRFTEVSYWWRTEETLAKLAEKDPKVFNGIAFQAAAERVTRFFRKDEMEPLRSAPTDAQDQEIALRRFTSFWLTRWLAGVSLEPDGRLKIEPRTWHEVNVLKQLTWEKVIAQPALGTVQAGQRRILRDLADGLHSILIGDERSQCPSKLRQLHAIARRDPDWAPTGHQASARAVLDYLCWMTEPQVLEIHGVLFGGATVHAYGSSWIR